MSAEFLLSALIVCLSPGPGVLFTIAAGLAGGGRASLVAALGCTLGILPHMAAAILGLAALLHTSALAFQMLKYAGVAYLLYMAWGTWRSRQALAVDEGQPRRPAGRVILSAVLINILNPKLSIFFLAFLPLFVDKAEPQPVLRMLELSGVFMAVTFLVFAVYGLSAAALRAGVIARPRVQDWLRRGFAAAFAGLGLKLALAER